MVGLLSIYENIGEIERPRISFIKSTVLFLQYTMSSRSSVGQMYGLKTECQYNFIGHTKPRSLGRRILKPSMRYTEMTDYFY